MSARDPASARGTVLAGGLLLVLLLGGFGGWASLARIAGAVVAGGQIEIERDRQVVQHLDGGVVAEILVRNGDRVDADTLLLRLDGNLLRSEHDIVESQYFELQARRGRLDAERDGTSEVTFPAEITAIAMSRPDVAALLAGQQSLFEARRASLSQTNQQLEHRQAEIASQIEGLDAQFTATRRQIALIQEESRDQETLLGKGLTQASRVLALQREEARLSGTAGELKAAKAEAEGRATEIDIERGKLETTRREEALTELRDLNIRELELAERRRALAEQVMRLEIRAPVAGIIQELAVTTPRAVIRPAEPLLYIIPQDRPLLVVARVPPVHIDEVQAGQAVTLRFSAFDMRTTPELRGTLSGVSADIITDPRAMVSYYRAEIELLPNEVAKLGGRPLVPGMPVEVFIRTGDRSPLSYLLQPFVTYFNRAFRET